MGIFSDDEITEINRYQRSGMYHPLTCPNGHGTLVATPDGLLCPECEYRQTWVHAWIRNGNWDVRNR
jgi:hypothetical protein